MYRLLVVFLVVLIAGCSTTGRDVPPDWQFDGKLSMRAGGESQIASIRWEQAGDHSRIRLSGPIGMGAVDIEVNGVTMQIRSGEGDQVIPLDQPIEVDGRRLVLPWQAMANWVRGLSASGRPIRQGVLTEAEWQIEILRDGSLGPRLMTFEHPAVSLRLSVSKWLISGA